MSDNSINKGKSLEDELIHKLRFANIESNSLRDMVGVVANLRKEGLEWTRIFPRGIRIDRPDGLTLRSIVKSSDIAKILAAIFRVNDQFLVSGVFVFPYGVIADFEAYQVDVALGPASAAPGEAVAEA
jgi:hypothetical protein